MFMLANHSKQTNYSETINGRYQRNLIITFYFGKIVRYSSTMKFNKQFRRTENDILEFSLANFHTPKAEKVPLKQMKSGIKVHHSFEISTLGEHQCPIA